MSGLLLRTAPEFPILSSGKGFRFSADAFPGLASFASEGDGVRIFGHSAAPHEAQRTRDDRDDKRVVFCLHAQHVVINVPLEFSTKAVKEALQVGARRLAARSIISGQSRELGPKNRVHFNGVIAAADEHQRAGKPLLRAVVAERVGIRSGRREIGSARLVRQVVRVGHGEIIPKPLWVVNRVDH